MPTVAKPMSLTERCLAILQGRSFPETEAGDALHRLLKHLSPEVVNSLPDDLQLLVKLNSSPPDRLAAAQHLETLPIHTDHVKPYGWMGFTLVADEWWPAHVMNILRNGWVEYATEYSDGSHSQGLAYRYKWADCSADNFPCLNIEDEESLCQLQIEESH